MNSLRVPLVYFNPWGILNGIKNKFRLFMKKEKKRKFSFSDWVLSILEKSFQKSYKIPLLSEIPLSLN